MCITENFVRRTILLFVSVILTICGEAQDPMRFKKEVADLKAKDSLVNKKNLNLFTGSSSIRFWTDLPTRYSRYNVYNTGFGGSQMSELFYYSQELILDYHPKRVFIYEGDNDLGEGKTAEEILSDAEKLLKFIRSDLSRKVKVYFITPKPSIRRWNLKENYENYIVKLKAWTAKQKNVGYIDVWTPMIDKTGALRTELFIEDGLHMNKKGYDIWEGIVKPYLKKK